MFTANNCFVGVDTSDDTFKIASLQKTRKGWKILHCQEVSKEENVNPLYNVPKNAIIVTSLSARDILVRACEIELKKEKDINAALDFQIEPLLPYPLEKAIIQYQIIRQLKQGSSLSIFSVRKDHLQHHLETCNAAGFEPDVVTFNSFALASSALLLGSHHTAPHLIIHINKKEVTCALVNSGKLLASRAFTRTHELSVELQKNLMALSSLHKEISYEKILLLGGDQKTADMIKRIAEKEVSCPSSPQWNISQEMMQKFGLAIAIALSAFDEKKHVDFRKKEFIYPNPWKRTKGLIGAYAAIASLLFMATVCWGYISLNNVKAEVQNRYIALAAFEGIVVDSKELPETAEEMTQEIKQLETKINKMPSTFPLMPCAPRVIDTLAWLSSHPLIRSHDMQIESFRYTMVQYPEINKQKEKYKIKVEFELSTQNSSNARAFHDALLTPNPFIDMASEIQWTPRKDRYFVSFFLKDKTQYVE